MRSRTCLILGATLLAVLVLVLLTSGCASSTRNVPTPTPWPTLVVTEKPLYTVATGTVTDSFELTGQVVPAEAEQLSFSVDGRLATLNVTTGSYVNEGDILAELEMQDLAEQLSQAQLTLDQAQQQLDEDAATREYNLARARLNLQRAQVELEALRQAAQTRQPLEIEAAAKTLEVSRVDLQQAQAAYDRAASQPGVEASPAAVSLQLATLNYELAEARYQLTTLENSDTEIALQEIEVQLQQLDIQQYESLDTSTLEARVTSAQMQVESLERQIEQHRMRAPYSGTVVAVGIGVQGFSTSRTITAQPEIGDSIAAFTTFIIVAKPEGLEIDVAASSQRVDELAVDMPVTVTHPLARSHPFVSQVLALPVTSVDGVTVTGAQVVRIAMPSDAPTASIGDYVKILVVKSVHRNTLYVPPAALRQFGERTFVVVQEGDKQRRVDVVVGLENDLQAEILSGLSADQVLVGQ